MRPLDLTLKPIDDFGVLAPLWIFDCLFPQEGKLDFDL